MASNVTRDHHNLRRNLKLNGNYISNDGGDEGLSVSDEGVVTASSQIDIGNMTLTTSELDVSSGNLTIDVAGDITLDAGGNDINLLGTASNLSFTQTSNDWLIANVLNDADIIFGSFTSSVAAEVMRIDASARSLLMASGKKIEFGAAGEYISGDGTDLTIVSSGHVEFDNCAEGFDQKEPAWGDANTIGGGGTSTDIDFRIGNKQHLTLAGNHVDSQELQMIFPTVSGNFLLFLLQDGTGDRTVHEDAWRAYSNDESTNSAVIWAGGTAPTLTTTADKADIVSIYWDADNEKAYGVISQNF